MLGADTRATGGTEVVDKNCEKIHYLAPNIWCPTGTNTAPARPLEETPLPIYKTPQLLYMSVLSNK